MELLSWRRVPPTRAAEATATKAQRRPSATGISVSEGTLRALVAANSFARAAGIVLALVAATLIGPAIAGPKTRAPAPRAETKVDSTFVFFGCNRIDAKDWEATRAANPSSANLPQLRQNLADAAKLAPDTLFFGGDLVMGYADDKGETLRSEVTAWIDVVKSLPRSHKTEYVALTGNHELNRKAGEAKLPGLYADAVWTELVRAAGWNRGIRICGRPGSGRERPAGRGGGGRAVDCKAM